MAGIGEKLVDVFCRDVQYELEARVVLVLSGTEPHTSPYALRVTEGGNRWIHSGRRWYRCSQRVLPDLRGTRRNPLGQGSDRERRVHAERAWHDRAVAHVQSVVHIIFGWVEYQTVSIHDTGRGIVSEATSSQWVNRHQATAEESTPEWIDDVAALHPSCELPKPFGNFPVDVLNAGIAPVDPEAVVAQQHLAFTV